jgi:hypothetical protein
LRRMKPVLVMAGEGRPSTSSLDARGTVFSWFLVRTMHCTDRAGEFRVRCSSIF